MSLKDHITTVAADLFSRSGIKRVSMEDVARKSNVSKRTLYEFFKDKESLLIDVLGAVHKPFFEHMDGKSEGTALDSLLLFHEKLLEKRIWVCNDFFEDIKRYPNALQALMERKQRVLTIIIDLLKRGEKESVFMSDVNYDLISLMIQQRFSKLEPDPIFTKYTHEEVHSTMFFIFIRGICTDLGRDIIEKFVLKKRYKKEFAYENL